MEFLEAWLKTMEWEGGSTLHHNRNDPGGLTKFGISQRAFPQEDIEGLTVERAKWLARARYWRVVEADDLPGELRWQVFDMAFNAGPSTSARLLQRSINLCMAARQSVGYLREDGDIGPVTLAALAMYDPKRITRVFMAYRAEYYLRVAEDRLPMFIYGWLRRAAGERNA